MYIFHIFGVSVPTYLHMVELDFYLIMFKNNLVFHSIG